MVTLSGSVLSQYRSFSLYNSPYPAHTEGCAIDLYPEEGAPSPVAGTVRETRTVRAPPKPYAAEHDHLIVLDTGRYLARILHVDPSVEPGDTVTIGTNLGQTIRSGYFAPWVDNHLHLGFRPPNANAHRASGSLRIEPAVHPEPVTWDGTGTVIERADTFVTLDQPGHPNPGGRFAGIAANGGVLDGGLPHYDSGGLIHGENDRITVIGTEVGTATNRTVTWTGVEVRVNTKPITGISLAIHRDQLGVKLVSWDGVPVDVGDEATVTITRV